MNLNYTFSDKSKKLTYVLIGIGVLAFAFALISKEVSGTRLWANLLIDSFFFFGISLGAVFFMSLQYAAQAGWPVVVKRVFEAVGTYLPVGAIFILIVMVGSAIVGMSGGHPLYSWMAKGVMVGDKILKGKSAYLNIPFFLIRTIIYLGVFVYLAGLLRKNSLAADLTDNYLPIHYKNVTIAGIFIVFFGLAESMASWDWIMSLDSHWLSTLFGWYVLSGIWVTAIIVIIAITVHLKSRGYLENVNESHLQNLALWMFAISILWSYLWFAQFMLIWYANIPDEVVYFKIRIDHYTVLLWVVFLMNLLLPLILLISRDAKRNTKLLITIAAIVFCTHWLDVFIMVMPSTVGEIWHIGFAEIGMFLGFLGLFIYVVLSSLAKVPLQVKNHPYLEESIHHHI
ncbi:MAG: quinol:cytochrome C oxidoreductase [Bacteroidia bacterium]